MIDLHSHLLPGIDDGAESLEVALEMARIAVADGVEVMACTPHIMPGVYENQPGDIARRTAQLADALEAHAIPLRLVPGADVHLAPDLLERLQSTAAPTLGATRYFLFEPPHHVMPPKLVPFCERLIAAGFVPILTHPERLNWIAAHWETLGELSDRGVLMQLTAGSLTGDFGRGAGMLADRLLDEGLCDIVASDAHNTHGRRPGLSRARAVVAERKGEDAARRMVLDRPGSILQNAPVGRERDEADERDRGPVERHDAPAKETGGAFRRFLRRIGGS